MKKDAPGWQEVFEACRRGDPEHAALLEKLKEIPPEFDDSGLPADLIEAYDDWGEIWYASALARWTQRGRPAETFNPEELYREQEFRGRVASGEMGASWPPMLSHHGMPNVIFKKTKGGGSNGPVFCKPAAV